MNLLSNKQMKEILDELLSAYSTWEELLEGEHSNLKFLGRGSEKEAYLHITSGSVIKVPTTSDWFFDFLQTEVEVRFIEETPLSDFPEDDVEAIEMILPLMAGGWIYSTEVEIEIPIIVMEYITPASSEDVYSPILNSYVTASDDSDNLEDFLLKDYGLPPKSTEKYIDAVSSLSLVLESVFGENEEGGNKSDMMVNFNNFGFNEVGEFKILDFGWGLG